MKPVSGGMMGLGRALAVIENDAFRCVFLDGQGCFSACFYDGQDWRDDSPGEDGQRPGLELATARDRFHDLHALVLADDGAIFHWWRTEQSWQRHRLPLPQRYRRCLACAPDRHRGIHVAVQELDLSAGRWQIRHLYWDGQDWNAGRVLATGRGALLAGCELVADGQGDLHLFYREAGQGGNQIVHYSVSGEAKLFLAGPRPEGSVPRALTHGSNLHIFWSSSGLNGPHVHCLSRVVGEGWGYEWEFVGGAPLLPVRQAGLLQVWWPAGHEWRGVYSPDDGRSWWEASPQPIPPGVRIAALMPLAGQGKRGVTAFTCWPEPRVLLPPAANLYPPIAGGSLGISETNRSAKGVGGMFGVDELEGCLQQLADEVDSMRKENASLQERLTAREGEVERLRRYRDRTEHRVRTLSRRLLDYEQQTRHMRTALNRADDEIKALRVQNQQLSEWVDQLRVDRDEGPKEVGPVLVRRDPVEKFKKQLQGVVGGIRDLFWGTD